MFTILIRAIHSKFTNWGITGLINLRIGTVLTITHTHTKHKRKEGKKGYERRGPFHPQYTPFNDNAYPLPLSLSQTPTSRGFY
jgi:hypothetical protein